jgi:hypothetical protein
LYFLTWQDDRDSLFAVSSLQAFVDVPVTAAVEAPQQDRSQKHLSR